ncbi:MAG: acyl carrier protein [Synergistaceae bacterium]|nr:acyl carrier protein [Synergistaceae bacterium]
MTIEERITLLAQTIEGDVSELKPDTPLDTLGYWDSLSKLSILAMFTTRFNRDIGVDTVRNFKTVGEILEEMHE